MNGKKIDTIMAHPLFNNAIHLLATLCFSYLLVRLILFILDVTQIGLGWLQTHKDASLLVLILLIIFSLAIVDLAISRGRRFVGDEKYSIVEIGLSYCSALIQSLRARTDRSFKQEANVIDAIEPDLKPVQIEIPIKEETSVELEELIAKPALFNEPESNIVNIDTVPILAQEGKRIIKAFQADHSINVIEFRSKVTQNDARLTVEQLKAPSKRAIPIEDQLVYESINIHTDISDDHIENAVIRFNVKREWIIDHNIYTIQLREFVNGNWNNIPTKRIGHDTHYLFYEAQVNAFSVPFAIGGI